MGCKKDGVCKNGKSCIGENMCPKGCSFAECLQRAKLVDAVGFAFRSKGSLPPFCKMCTKKQLERPQRDADSGLYIKMGNKRFSLRYNPILYTHDANR